MPYRCNRNGDLFRLSFLAEGRHEHQRAGKQVSKRQCVPVFEQAKLDGTSSATIIIFRYFAAAASAGLNGSQISSGEIYRCHVEIRAAGFAADNGSPFPPFSSNISITCLVILSANSFSEAISGIIRDEQIRSFPRPGGQ